MSTRQRRVVGLIVAVVASWPVAAIWFLVMVLIGLSIDAVLTGPTTPGWVPVVAAVASLPITAIPGMLAGLMVERRARALLPPALGGMAGAACALLLPVGSVSFFVLTLTAIPIGSGIGLLLVRRQSSGGTTVHPPPPPSATPMGPTPPKRPVTVPVDPDPSRPPPEPPPP